MPVKALQVLDLVVMFTWLVLDGIIVFRKRGSKPDRRDRLSMLVIIFATWIGISLAISFGALHLGTFGRGTPAVQVIGLVLLVVGIATRSLAIAQLGRFHMPVVAIQAGHHVVDTGLYRHVRHPSYLGACVAFVGFGLGLGSWLSAATLVGIGLLAYSYRIHVEEQALLASLGEEYAGYRRRTRRLIPGLY